MAAVGERDRALRALLDEQDGEAARRGSRRARRRRRRRCVGASPSDGSSSRSTSGSATSARAIASCCCWPPESAPAWRAPELVARSGRARRRARARRASPPRAPRRRGRAGGSPRPSARRRCAGPPARARCRARATSSGRGRASDAPSSRTSPPATGAAPMIACSVDDLPAPFGPIRPTISPGFDLERQAAHGARPRRSGPRGPRRRARSLASSSSRTALSPRYAAATSRFARISAGVPSASVVALVEHVDAVADVHDQRHVVVDQQHAGAVVVAHGADDRGERRAPPPRAGPAAGSSMSTKRGSVASARATPSRRSSPCASEAAGLVRVGGEAEQLEQLVRPLSPPAAATAPTPSADDLDVLPHRQRRGRRGCAGTCARARAGRAGAPASA